MQPSEKKVALAQRRKFMFNVVKTLIAANLGIYLVGTLNKKLDGSLVAGAK